MFCFAQVDGGRLTSARSVGRWPAKRSGRRIDGNPPSGERLTQKRLSSPTSGYTVGTEGPLLTYGDVINRNPEAGFLSHDIIVVGASAGGVQATIQIASALPADLGAAAFVVVHTGPHSPGRLAELIDRAGPLPATYPEHGDPIEKNRIYVASPDNDLLVKPGSITVVRGPKENFTRPAIDPLFRSAALSYGPRVIGVVLTGGLDDGTAGLLAVKVRGGIAVAQDPESAYEPSMPLSALESVSVDHCVPLPQIAPLLAKLARYPAAPVKGTSGT